MSTRSSHVPENRHWSHSAIASFVLSVMGFATLWLVVGLFFAAAGAVAGHLGRHATVSGEKRGRGLATVGTGLGYFSMLTFPIILLIFSAALPAMQFWESEKSQSFREASLAKASELFQACESYARANSNRYPEEWDQLSGRFLSEKELRDLLRSPYPEGSAVAFEIVPHDRTLLDGFSDSVIVIQEIAPPTRPHAAVVKADGSVQSIPNPAAP